MSEKKYIQSITRASTILQYIATNKTAKLSEICLATGLKKSTAFSILQTLEHIGQITRTSNGLEYTLGIQSLKLGLYYLHGSDFSKIVRELLTRLVSAVEETAYFELEIGGRYYYLDCVVSNHSLKVVPDEDHFIDSPEHSALGQVFKSTDPNFRYAKDLEGVEKGLNCFAAPYRTDGETIGCIVLTGPSSRFTEDKMEETYMIFQQIMKDLGLEEHL